MTALRRWAPVEPAYRRNARHGRQLIAGEKQDAACDMFRTFGGSVDERYEKIAEILGIKLSVAKKYAAAARADEQAQKREKAWDLWLDCCKTQQEIGEELSGKPTDHRQLDTKSGIRFQIL